MGVSHRSKLPSIIKKRRRATDSIIFLTQHVDCNFPVSEATEWHQQGLLHLQDVKGEFIFNMLRKFIGLLHFVNSKTLSSFEGVLDPSLV